MSAIPWGENRGQESPGGARSRQTASSRSQRQILLARKTKRRALFACLRGCLCRETARTPEAKMQVGDPDPPPSAGVGRGEGSLAIHIHPSLPVLSGRTHVSPLTPERSGGAGTKREVTGGWGCQRVAHSEPHLQLAATLSARARLRLTEAGSAPSPTFRTRPSFWVLSRKRGRTAALSSSR